MARERRNSPVFTVFMLLMIALLLGGLALVYWGSTHNGLAMPRVPGFGPLADALGVWHG